MHVCVCVSILGGGEKKVVDGVTGEGRETRERAGEQM